MPRKKRRTKELLVRRKSSREKRRRISLMRRCKLGETPPEEKQEPPNETILSPLTETDNDSEAMTLRSPDSFDSSKFNTSQPSKPTWREEQKTRDGIIDIFLNHLGEPPPELWSGKGGTIARLNAIYKNCSRQRIYRTLHKYWETNSTERKKRIYKGEYMVQEGGVSEQLIADCMEDGMGYSMATDLVNEQRTQDGMEKVGQTTVRNTYLRLQPKEEKIVTVSQGSFCAHSNWAKAGFAWCKQLAICFGVLDPYVTLDPPMPPPLVEPEVPPPRFPLTVEGGIADCFDPDLLTKYNRYQVAFWDECHPKCDLRSSDCGRKQNMSVPRVKRDSEGKLDKANGTYLNTKPTDTKVKYPKEGRFAFGVAMTKLRDGTVVGRRCKEFCYTEQNIIAHDQWLEKIEQEIRNVKKLIGTDKEDKWITDPGKGKVYADDSVDIIRGIGAVMKKSSTTQASQRFGSLLTYMTATKKLSKALQNR